MALLIMSIGIVSLTTMFPLSVLRSIKASQLTHAADLRYNVESVLDIRPGLLARAIADSDAFQNTLPANQRNLIGFVIDPLGYHGIDAGGTTALLGQRPASMPNTPGLPIRHHGGTDTNLIPEDAGAAEAAQHTAAEFMATLPDSWVTMLDHNLPGGMTTGGAEKLIIAGLAASGFTMPTSGSARIVLFSADGSSNQSRTILSFNPATDTVFWTEDVDASGGLNGAEDLNGNGLLDTSPLPTNFNSKSVRIETQEARYTWMLTVRKSQNILDPTAEVDVVVFFRRSFETDPVNDLSGNQLYEGAVSAGSRVVTVTPDPAQPKPFIKAGHYMLDVDNLRWYRIRAAQANSNVVVLDQKPVVSSPGAGKLMFPRGVVDVFPVGKKKIGP